MLRIRSSVVAFALVGSVLAPASAPAAPQRSESKTYVGAVDTPSRNLQYPACNQPPHIGGTCFTPPPGAETVRFQIADATSLPVGAQIRFLAANATRLLLADQCAPTDFAIPAGTDRIQVFVNSASTRSEACNGVGTTGTVTATYTMAEPDDDPGGAYVPSQPVYEVLAEPKRYVDSNGIKIQADVYRPNAAGAFPVIVWFDVYGKDDAGAVVNSERDFFVSRGFAFVHASSPGSNTSGGSYENAFGPAEQQAAYDVVEWAGVQPWSNGKVGMQGLSYAAIIEYFVAAMRPPHLVTIYPTSAYADLYREIVYTGGNLQAGYPILWDTNNRAVGYGPPTRMPHDPSDTPTMATGYATTIAGFRPILGDFVTHPTADDFYAVRSPITRNHQIEVPAAIDVGWDDDMVHGGPLNFETIGSSDKRLIIGPWGHSAAHRRPDGRSERLRWFDHYLKGKPSGVDTDPRVRVFVPRGGIDADGSWIAATGWPLPATSLRTWHLGDESLLDAPPSATSSHAYTYSPSRHAANVSDVDLGESVRFETPALEQEVTVAGYGELVLHASTTASDTSFTVTLFDVDASGRATRLQQGWLRASMRRIDPERSEPGRPVHAFTGAEPVTAGEIVEYRIGLWPFANTFPAGHKLRIEISDLPRGPGGAPFLAPVEPGTNTVYAGPESRSRLLLAGV